MIILSIYLILQNIMNPTKMTLELHSEDEIVATETLHNYEASRRYWSLVQIQDNWKNDLLERLGLKGNFKSVLIFS